MEEEKNRERKERIDTIFMYESRIKGTVIYYSGYYGPSSTDDPDLGMVPCPYFPVYDFYRRRSLRLLGNHFIDFSNEILTYQKQIIYF